MAGLTTQPELYITRISSKNEESSSCYLLAKVDYEMTDKLIWDSDQFNLIKPDDYLAFITGERGEEICEIYKAVAVLPQSERPIWWNKGVNRNPIQFTREHDLPETWSWSVIKASLKLAVNVPYWMPTSTQRAKHANCLPFTNPFISATDKTDKVAKKVKEAKIAKKVKVVKEAKIAKKVKVVKEVNIAKKVKVVKAPKTKNGLDLIAKMY